MGRGGRPLLGDPLVAPLFSCSFFFVRPPLHACTHPPYPTATRTLAMLN